MKVQCDVCGKEAAAVFCCADEAVLCEPCDRRVHHANKLAGKHRRFSLLPSSSSPSLQSHSVCDICQERRGFVFCQEDRAILCRDCDGPIHSANDLTKKHNRFLLTGLRLSSTPISFSSSSPEAEMVAASNNNNVPESNQDKALPADDLVLCSSDSSITSSTFAAAAPVAGDSSTGGGSSISDYLIKMCPGWRVEDLLVDDAAAAAAAFAADGFSKTPMDEMLPFMEVDLEGAGLEAVAEEFPIWVPHVPQIPPPDLPAVPGGTAATAGVHYQPWVAAKDLNSTHHHHGAKAAGRERWSDDAFTVPQIAAASSNPGKRPRQQPLW
ncbi:B-box zinc finger protein 20-like isoform X2 [Phoenix dactylifera]|uniref:B-box zinc finger protein 20-like isoform X2 n=1 Tax=Phoenix dactylifera TaxID=42345 RepID=A0A8B7BEH7_PHODC|nr:B-box zinc finger protein 20-like isoform X2 [Phoenix dactylifera]